MCSERLSFSMASQAQHVTDRGDGAVVLILAPNRGSLHHREAVDPRCLSVTYRAWLGAQACHTSKRAALGLPQWHVAMAPLRAVRSPSRAHSANMRSRA